MHTYKGSPALSRASFSGSAKPIGRSPLSARQVSPLAQSEPRVRRHAAARLTNWAGLPFVRRPWTEDSWHARHQRPGPCRPIEAR